MKYLSLFSGIEAATAAWHGLGWKPVAFSEIEAFPSAVLAHHYPDVPNLGDMTKVAWNKYHGLVDLMVGGSPCQAFSVAGLRQSLDDTRGNLTLEYARAIFAVRPRWVVWENVPGVLSTKDNAFGCFLALLSGADAPLQPPADGWGSAGVVAGEPGAYGLSWRVLDAQYFGVAQRRRRVFVVGHLGDWRPAAQVLLEPAGVCGNSPPRREAGQRVAPSVTVGPPFSRTGNERVEAEAMVVQPLGLGDDGETARALNACHTASGRHDVSVDTFVAHSLRAEGHDASEDGTGRGTPLVPVAFPWQSALDPIGQPDNISGTLIKNQTMAVAQPLNTINPMAFKIRGGSPVDTGSQGSVTPGRAAGKGFLGSEERAFTLGATQDQYVLAVRRLTPRECERLQGFPDDYTAVPYRKKPAADGPRYKALGNSMAVPCMAWIGRRIQLVEEALRGLAA